MTGPLPGDGPDTALARLLHATQRVRLDVLRPLLEAARAGGPGLGASLVARQILSSAELAAYEGRLRGPAGRLAAGELVAERYRIESLLGQGGMGAVYRASEVSTGRALAVKVLLAELAEEVDVRRFQVEGELGALVGGLEGFVPVHAAGTHRGLPYLAMGLVEGKDLEASIDSLSPQELAAILSQAARALHEAHLVGVVHRDLKPGNILLDERGQPLIADLGLARAGVAQALTQTGEILGTPAYMAPEQIEDPRSVDPRSDVYALGAILYRGLAGGPPFQGPLLQVLDHVLTRQPPALPAELPSEVRAIVRRALAKDPGARYPSALALAEDLERFTGGERVSAESGSKLLRGGLVACVLLASVVLLIWAGAGRGVKAPSPTPSARVEVDRGQRERERVSRQLRRVLLTVAGGGRGDLEAIRGRTRRGGLDPLKLEAEALRAVADECVERILTSEDPVKRFANLREALSPSLCAGAELQTISDGLFRGLLGENPQWLHLARLAPAIRPLRVPEFAKVAALDAYREAHAGLKVPPELAQACLQLDSTMRGAGLLVFQRSLLPRGTGSTLEQGSETRAFLDLLNGAPSGMMAIDALSPDRFRRFAELVQRVREAPLEDLGQQYVWEVELVWLRCEYLREVAAEEIRARLKTLRTKLQATNNLHLLAEATTFERSLTPAEGIRDVLAFERELVEACLAARPTHPNGKRDRDYILARAVEAFARDSLLLEEWEPVVALHARVDPKIFESNTAQTSKRHLATLKLCRAWSSLASDPRATIAGLGDLVENEDLDLYVGRVCAQLLLARAHLALGERSEAARVLDLLATRPQHIGLSRWQLLRKVRDEIRKEVDEP